MDLEAALAPTEVEGPCGLNLKGTLEWGEFERLAASKPAQYVGPTLVAAAEDPPWSQVVERATALLARTKDLRLAVHCTKALIRTRGWNGVATGLGLIHGLVDRYWNDLHPALDRDENDDPTMRLNCLADLSEDEDTLAALRGLAVVNSPRAGKLSLKDILQARSGTGSTTQGVVTAVFAEVDLPTLAATAGQVHQAWEHLLAIERIVGDHIGSAHSLNLVRLRNVLKDADGLLTEKVSARQSGSEQPAGEGAAMANISSGNGAPAAVYNGGATLGAIRTRDDVARALDAICEYYRVQEPSSPLPLLLTRARRLIAKDFLSIVRDLAPAGMDQIETIRGPEETSS